MSNAEAIGTFIRYCMAKGLSKPRVLKYGIMLRRLSLFLGKDFTEATKEDIVGIVSRVESSGYSKWYKNDLKVCTKRFYKWLEGNDEEYPRKVRWIKSKRIMDMPRELLGMMDVHSMIEASDELDLRLLICLLWETGARVGELLTLRAGNVMFDDRGAVIIVDGKTGPRRLRVMEAAELLHNHVRGLDANDLLFPFCYNVYAKRLKACAVAAGITKRVTPHTFRHSRATYLANFLTEFQLKKMFGWSMSSDMAAVYVHLSGADVDTALLRVHELERRKSFIHTQQRVFHTLNDYFHGTGSNLY